MDVAGVKHHCHQCQFTRSQDYIIYVYLFMFVLNRFCFFLGSAQQTEAFVRLRVAHKHLFTGGRDSATIQCCKINAQPIICNVCNF